MPKVRYEPLYIRLEPWILRDLRRLAEKTKVPVAAMLRYGAAQAVAYYEEVAAELDAAKLADGSQRRLPFK